jgi:hypothetical protein
MSIAEWLVDRLSRMLDPEEREVVQGDLCELRVPPSRAIHDVLSLLARRQVAQWKGWRPWTVLAVLVAPLGFTLALNSVWLGRSYNLYLWILGNYRDINPGILQESHIQLGSGIALLVCHSLLLASWSWSAGFVLAAISRGATVITGALFCGMLWVGEMSAIPRRVYFIVGSIYTNSLHPGTLLMVLLSLLVCLPAVWGMWKGCRRSAVELLPALMLAATVACLTVIARLPGWWINWPVLYILITSILQHRRTGARQSA